jgi:hypothetical protein
LIEQFVALDLIKLRFIRVDVAHHQLADGRQIEATLATELLIEITFVSATWTMHGIPHFLIPNYTRFVRKVTTNGSSQP